MKRYDLREACRFEVRPRKACSWKLHAREGCRRPKDPVQLLRNVHPADWSTVFGFNEMQLWRRPIFECCNELIQLVSSTVKKFKRGFRIRLDEISQSVMRRAKCSDATLNLRLVRVRHLRRRFGDRPVALFSALVVRLPNVRAQPRRLTRVGADGCSAWLGAVPPCGR